MRRGVNAGFGDSLTGELAGLRAHGIGYVRQMLRRPDGQGDPAARVAELRDAGLSPCWLVERRGEAAALPAGAWATWQNEPDLNGWSPSQYAESVRQVLRDRPDVTWWTGGISNLTNVALNWLAEFVRFCPEVPGIEVHRYPPKWDPRQPHEGFASRDTEVARLKAIIGARPYIVGEFGYHLARYRVWWIFWSRHSDQEQADAYRYEWEFWATHGAQAAYAYQIQDGPTDTPIDRYGLRSQHGHWRLSAGTFGPTVPAPDPPAPTPEPDPEPPPAPPPPTDPPSDAGWRLVPGETMLMGAAIYSRGRRYRLVLQNDGNAVVYRVRDMDALWATDTSIGGAFMFVMQHDGNLVLYDVNGLPVWDSDTDGYAGAYAELRDDGAFVMVLPDGTERVLGPADPNPDLPVVGRTGRVRLEGRVLADDGGPWCALGLPLFWAVRGCYDGEQDRVRANVRWAREQGADFVRVFAETSDWKSVAGYDRRTDPRWLRYADDLRTVRDICVEEGVRIAWTLFGGNHVSPSEQAQCVGDWLGMANERPEHVLCVEISNEMNGFGDGDGERRMRTFAHQVRAHGYLVTLTSVAHAPYGLYLVQPPDPSAADFANVHFDRKDGDRGWRWVRQPWGYPGEYQDLGPAGLPDAFGTLEPGGPGASVHSDMDPERIAMAAVHTWLCGGCLHVVHCGAGIYGVPMTHPTVGFRPADLWEQPALASALALIRQHRERLPIDLPNWVRTRHGYDDHPFDFPFDPEQQKYTTVGDLALERGQGCVRCYAAYNLHGEYVAAPIGVMDEIVLRGTSLESWSLREAEGRSYLLRGRFRA